MLKEQEYVLHRKSPGKEYGNKRQNYPCNRSQRPIGLWEVEAPTYYRQSAHRWR
jgi:hypothetical protein